MTAERLPTASARPDDAWNKGDPYELYVGRWSHLVAKRFVGWLNVPPSLRWLDVGCGTGALCAAIAESCQPAQLIGVDPSEGFLAKARERLGSRATFHLGDAMDLPSQDASVDVVVSGLVLNFIPSPASGLAEMKRKAAAGATIAAYVWDYAGRMELMRHFWDAAVELNPDARGLDEGVRFPLCDPRALTEAFRTRDSARSASRRSKSIPASGTSTTTGVRSSAARDRRRATRCRSPKRRAPDCGTASVGASPSGAMARSRLSRGRGR